MIRDGKMAYSDLPAIQVIVGPDDPSSKEEGPWYFSLNNRRLWVLKRCREEGLLDHVRNEVQVRVKECKSADEARRYTVENCALSATFMREARRGVESGDRKDKDSCTKVQESVGSENLKDVCCATDKMKLSVNDDGKGEQRQNVDGLDHDNDEDKNKSKYHNNVNGVFDVNDDDSESDEDIEPPRTSIYKNPFCLDSGSSSSDESSD